MLRIRQRVRDTVVTPGDLRDVEDVDTIMIHRFGGDLAWWDKQNLYPCADSVRDFYTTNPEGRDATGGECPYPLVVGYTGDITQLEPLLRITPHAARWNVKALGVAFLGDFRRKAPGIEQWNAGVELVAWLLTFWPLAQVLGHSDAPGASKHIDKVCPGPHLNVSDMVAEARAQNKTRAGVDLIESGIIFGGVS